MNILVVGAGSIGKRHLRNLLHIGIANTSLFAVETRDDRQSEVKELGINNIYKSIDEATQENKIDAAIICSPTSLHIEHAIEIAKKNIHLMIEKPLSRDLQNIDQLKNIVEENNLAVLMAYIFRFSPLTKKVKEILEMPIAHGEGNFFCKENILEELENNQQIIFKYSDSNGSIAQSSNPNGSLKNIAGISNKRGNVLGLMPHPERACESILGGEDGLKIFSSALSYSIK